MSVPASVIGVEDRSTAASDRPSSGKASCPAFGGVDASRETAATAPSVATASHPPDIAAVSGTRRTKLLRAGLVRFENFILEIAFLNGLARPQMIASTQRLDGSAIWPLSLRFNVGKQSRVIHIHVQRRPSQPNVLDATNNPARSWQGRCSICRRRLARRRCVGPDLANEAAAHGTNSVR